jgi:ribonuclease III
MGMDLKELVRANKERLSELEKAMKYRFTDLRLLQKALVHSSYAFEQSQAGSNNERLEFIGDAVLDLVVGHLLYKKYGKMREGELTRLRAALVNETHLAAMARQLDLGLYLCLGKGEDASQGRNKSSILSCAFEAVIGAVFEDAGYEVVAEIVFALFIPAIEDKKEEMLIADAKSRLQEKLQETHNEGPDYRLDKEEGPSHQKVFTISVLFQGEVLGCGEARSKKEAEQRAASAALKKLQ